MSILGQWSQQVTIGTVTDAAVADLSISEQSRAPVTDIDFTVEEAPATIATLNAIAINENVTVTHTGKGGYVRTWRAKISGYTYERGANFSKIKVQCKTLEQLAKRERIAGQFAGRLDTVLENIWNQYGSWIVPGTNIGLLSEGVEIEPAWDTLFNVISDLVSRFDYAWWIDAGSDELVVADPRARSSPDIRQADGDIVGKTLTLATQAEDIVNAVIASGYIYREVTEQINMPTGGTLLSINDIGCRKGLHSEDVERLISNGWEVASKTVLDDFAVQSIAEKREIEVTEDGWINFKPALIPADQAPAEDTKDGMRVDFRVQVTMRRRGQAIVKNQASINQYGRREGEPIKDDGGGTLEQMKQRAQIVVDSRGWPQTEADLEPTRPGTRSDTMVRLVTTNPPGDATLFVDSVSHTVRGNELTISTSLSREDDS